MNGPHDVGGAHGFGPVEAEPDEPAFHASWEGRTLALHVAMGATGAWTVDQMRFARERIAPARYLAISYYESFADALERLVVESGLVGPEELAAGKTIGAAQPVRRILAAGDVAKVLSRGASSRRPDTGPARFAAGDVVRARNIHPATHTRLPRYVRGHVGTVTHVLGCHVFPDTRAHGQGDQPQWLYTVRFTGPELWGPGTDPMVSVAVDAFEPYLEPADGGG